MWLDLAKCKKLFTILKGWIRTREARFCGCSIWQIRIHNCKDTACIHEHPSGKGATLAVQPITEAAPELHLLTAEHICPHSAGRVSDPHPRIDTRTNPMLGAGVGLAILYRNSRCIRSRGQGGRHRQLSACTPVLFQWEWPDDIKRSIISSSNWTGAISNSNLKMAGLVMLWLVIEEVCPDLRKKPMTLFSDNSPTVSWATQLASRWSLVAEYLDQALALHLKIMHACPLTPMHIEGKKMQLLMCRHGRLAATPRERAHPLLNCSPCSILFFLCRCSNLGQPTTQIAQWLRV
jgi:hypothetical protein